MGVMIEPLFSRTSFKRWIDKSNKIVFEEYKNELQKIGQEAQKIIHSKSQSESWIDHTQNLRSSIGYAVYSKGMKVAMSAFNYGDGAEGKTRGKALAESLASEYTKTLTLVILAAMPYADYVEAHDNKDVLASTLLWEESILNKRLQNASKRANKRINALKL